MDNPGAIIIYYPQLVDMFYVLLLCYFDLRLNDIIDYSDDLQIVGASDDLQIVEAFDARFRCEVLAQNKCLLVEIKSSSYPQRSNGDGGGNLSHYTTSRLCGGFKPRRNSPIV